MKRSFVKKLLKLMAMASAALLPLHAQAQQQTPAATGTAPTALASPSQTQKHIEAYLRNLYAFGPDVTLTVGPLKESQVEGVLETDVSVTLGENRQNAKLYVSKDGRYLFRGELSDLTKDPLAENLALMRISDAPALGDPKAPVTIVEYSDFQCPVCRSLHDTLRGILPNYPGKLRVIFKDFPLEDRKSTRLNSSHDQISYAVFCLKKKKTNNTQTG